jgi:hypothetical protein
VSELRAVRPGTDLSRHARELGAANPYRLADGAFIEIVS